MAFRTGLEDTVAAGGRESSAEEGAESLAALEGPYYRKTNCSNWRRSSLDLETRTEPGVLMSDIVQNVP